MIILSFWLQECEAKEKEDRKDPTELNQEQDEIPLFYSDIMPLLVWNFTLVICFYIPAIF